MPKEIPVQINNVEQSLRETRRCKKCKLEKDVIEFQLGRRAGTKLFQRCAECRSRSQHPNLPLEPRYWIRHHAIERYLERVTPELSFKKARCQMIRAMESAPLLKKAPWWLAAGQARPGRGLTEGYLLVSADVVFLVGCYPGDRRRGTEPRVKTVLVRESLAKITYRHTTFGIRRLRGFMRSWHRQWTNVREKKLEIADTDNLDNSDFNKAFNKSGQAEDQPYFS